MARPGGTQPPPEAARRPRRVLSGILWVLIGLVIVALAVGVVGIVIVDAKIKDGLSSRLGVMGEQLGLSFEMGSTSWSPDTLTIQKVSASDAEGGALLATFDTITVSYEPNFDDMAVVVTGVVLHGGHTTIDESRLDILHSLIDELGKIELPGGSGAGGGGGPKRVVIAQRALDIRDYQIEVTLPSVSGTLQVAKGHIEMADGTLIADIKGTFITEEIGPKPVSILIAQKTNGISASASFEEGLELALTHGGKTVELHLTGIQVDGMEDLTLSEVLIKPDFETDLPLESISSYKVKATRQSDGSIDATFAGLSATGPKLDISVGDAAIAIGPSFSIRSVVLDEAVATVKLGKLASLGAAELTSGDGPTDDEATQDDEASDDDQQADEDDATPDEGKTDGGDDEVPEEPDGDIEPVDIAKEPPAPNPGSVALGASLLTQVDAMTSSIELFKLTKGKLVVADQAGKELMALAPLDVKLESLPDHSSRAVKLSTAVQSDGKEMGTVNVTATLGAELTDVKFVEATLAGCYLGPIVGQLLDGFSFDSSLGCDTGTTFSLTFLGDIIEFNGEVSLEDFTFDSVLLSEEPVEKLSFSTQFSGTYDKVADVFAATLKPITFGKVEAAFEVEVERFSEPLPKIHAHLNFPRQGCQDLFDSIPSSLVPHLKGFEVVRKLDFDMDYTVDLAEVHKMYEARKSGKKYYYEGTFEVTGDVSCKVMKQGYFLNVKKLNKDSFIHKVEIVDKKTDEVVHTLKVGPGTKNYVPLALLPSYVAIGAIATEDHNFMSHQGINWQLIRRGIELNLYKKRFAYGGSTISQQLVKNLFLSRTKTLSRKLEEMIITWYMEQKVSKERILELYLNCIEFGPAIYGIRAASLYYFSKEPTDLELNEACFLMVLKPSPIDGWWQYKKKKLSGTWKRAIKLCAYKLYKKLEYISQEEYEAAAPYDVQFVYPPGYQPGWQP